MAKATKNLKSDKDFDVRKINEEKLKYINTPTILYKVGDRVQHGAVKKSVVADILCDGKILILDETVTEHNYGDPYDHERQIQVAWHDVQLYEGYKKASKQKMIANPNIYPLNFSQRDVSSLIHMKYNAGIDLNPEYQRDLVWSQEDKENLIESIFNYVDIGKFVLFRRDFSSSKELYEIIDGKQRLTALLDFFENRFTFRGKFFNELHPSDQRHFEGYAVSFAMLERVDKQTVLNTFVRLNTGGRPVDPMHIEKVKKMIK